MMQALLRGRLVHLVMGILLGSLGYVGCSMGTNTGNGMNPGSGGGATGGSSGTGGGSGYCLKREPCDELADATGADGETYRGTIRADVTIASTAEAQAAVNPPVAQLSFLGHGISESDAGCHSTDSALSVGIYVSVADSSLDDTGALRVRSEGRDDSYASGPGASSSSTHRGWAVDLTLTPGGQLTATLSLDSESFDGGETAAQTLKLSGRVMPLCIEGPDGTSTPATMPVNGGGRFTFFCSRDWICGSPPRDQ